MSVWFILEGESSDDIVVDAGVDEDDDASASDASFARDVPTMVSVFPSLSAPTAAPIPPAEAADGKAYGL